MSNSCIMISCTKTKKLEFWNQVGVVCLSWHKEKMLGLISDMLQEGIL